MTAERNPPSTVTRAPEWVGEGDRRRDVSHMSDRALLIEALNIIEHQTHALQVHSSAFIDFQAAFLREIPELTARVDELEIRMAGGAVERQSSHEWDRMLIEAGQRLSQRVKDPQDRLDSNRARSIAKEVIEAAKTADDAAAFRKIKVSGWKIALEVLKVIAAALVGGAGVHFGLHRGGK
jgi:hypothetical protein